MSVPKFGLNRPRTPEEEGVILGLTVEEDYSYIPSDEGGHPDITVLGIDIQEVDDALIDRDDFAEGVVKGITLRRELSARGFKVLLQESEEALMSHSYGGSA